MSARFLISCGEASGDLYAGALTRELLALDATIRVAGLGGPQFAAAGGTLVDDYRDVDGIQFAFEATQKVGPLSVERKVTDVKINPPIDPALFKRPAS